MKEYETRTTRIVVLPKDADLFHALATTIEITDEGGGEFLAVKQSPDCGEGVIRIDPCEWNALKAGIDTMVEQCRLPPVNKLTDETDVNL